jgi:threonine aldolase
MAAQDRNQLMLAAFIAQNHERLILQALQHYNIEHKPGCAIHDRVTLTDCDCGRNVVLEAAQVEVAKEPDVVTHFPPEEAVNLLVAMEGARGKKG